MSNIPSPGTSDKQFGNADGLELSLSLGETIVRTIFPEGEPNRDLRGHLLLPATLAEAIPEVYATEDVPCAEKIVHAHYFGGAMDWYVCELDRGSGDMFGAVVANGDRPEWGYWSIRELAKVTISLTVLMNGAPVQIGHSTIERDFDFVPRTITELGI